MQTDGVAVTTELPVAFKFHMPYLTIDGSPTNLLVACGPQVSVNIILGVPFLSASGMTIIIFTFTSLMITQRLNSMDE